MALIKSGQCSNPNLTAFQSRAICLYALYAATSQGTTLRHTLGEARPYPAQVQWHLCVSHLKGHEKLSNAIMLGGGGIQTDGQGR